MSEVFDPSREFYQLTSSEGLAALVDDLRSIVGAENWDAYDNRQNGEILREAFGDKVSLTQARELFTNYRLTNRIVRTEDREAAPEFQEVDDRPRNEDGTFKSEFQEFFEANTASAIRARAAHDLEFGKWFRATLAGGMTQAADGVEQQLQQPSNVAEQAHPALRKFARQYTETPSSKLKPIAGYVTVLDGTRFTVVKFNELVSLASSAKLL
jgi:hypothetical protein